MTPKKLLKELQEFTTADTVHMYIIERKLKPNSKSSDRPSEKFQYIPVQINLSPELVPLVSGMLEKAIEKKVTEDVQILDYEPIDDTLEKLYTYSDLGKIAGFKEFLANLGNKMKTLTSFKELEDLEKAWALCYGYYHANKKKWLYCIKKLSPKKIAVEVNVNTTVKDALKHGIQSFFDTKTKMLKPLNGFSINLDPSIDMVYHDETIYIFQKKAFEELASLTEEFEELAQEVVQEIEDLEIIEGVTFLTAIVAAKPSFRNKLIKAQAIGNINFLNGKTAKEVKKEFNRVGKRLNIKFNFDADNKVLAENDGDAKNIIDVLCEFYKEGVFGGKIFESPAGRIKKT
ncbi:MAG: DUF4868 domain-containing protein [Chitinophagaceae bacterium]|jgi:hypothetical protein|nr:DUF4868 domain-containing protein [Chitinophagaceae bacterium]